MKEKRKEKKYQNALIKNRENALMDTETKVLFDLGLTVSPVSVVNQSEDIKYMLRDVYKVNKNRISIGQQIRKVESGPVSQREMIYKTFKLNTQQQSPVSSISKINFFDARKSN